MKGSQILYIVLAVTIVLLIAIAYDSRRSATEGFAINGCPQLSTTKGTMIYGKNSTKICCYGKVENGKCVADPKLMPPSTPVNTLQCILGKSSDSILECGEFKNKIVKSIPRLWPKSMTNVFFTSNGLGCTDGPLNATGDGPLHASSKQCMIPFKDGAFDYNDIKTNPNNCLNQMKLDDVACIGAKCNKFIRTAPDNNGVIIGMDFISPDGVPATCYDNASFGSILSASGIPSDKVYRMQASHPMSCDVAKKLYVDRSMKPTDVQLLP